MGGLGPFLGHFGNHFVSRGLLFGKFGTRLPDFGTILEGLIPYFGIPYSSRIKCKSNIH
jgi:hypothetical protein